MHIYIYIYHRRKFRSQTCDNILWTDGKGGGRRKKIKEEKESKERRCRCANGRGRDERSRENVTKRVRGERETETQSINHLSIYQWVRSAIHASKKLASPVVSYL